MGHKSKGEIIMGKIIIAILVVAVVYFIIGVINEKIRNKKNSKKLQKIYSECGISLSSNEVWDSVANDNAKSTKLNLDAEINAIKMPTTFDELKEKALKALNNLFNLNAKDKIEMKIIEQSEIKKEINGLVWNMLIVKLSAHSADNQNLIGTRIYAYLFIQNYCIEVKHTFDGENPINEMENKYDILFGFFKRV